MKRLGVAGVTAQKSVRTELPHVTRLGYGQLSEPILLDGIRADVGLEVDHNLVDLGRRKSANRNLEAFPNQKVGKLRQFDGKDFAIPASVFGDFVVGKRQRPLLCR